MGKNEEAATAARDFVLARLAVCRENLAAAMSMVSDVINHFIDTSDDVKGGDRKELLETIDTMIGESARAVQLAQERYDDVDPEEGEPDPDDDDDDEEDEEPEDEKPRRRGRG